MSTLEKPAEPVAVSLKITDDDLVVSLSDGRTLTVPIAWYSLPAEASPADR